MKKKVFYTELAYIFGIFLLAVGTALTEATGLGVSMVVAPAYIMYLKISEYFSFFSFGMAEYTLQAILLVIMAAVLRKFKVSYLFSFVTAVIYGAILDGAMAFLPNVSDFYLLRFVFYAIGLFFCSAGVSLLFHTYIPPEVYELFVKEVSEKFNIDINKFKTGYDCVSCFVAVILSLLLFGSDNFKGIGVGTMICAVLNGWLIGKCTKFFEKHFEFEDSLKLRKYF